MLAQRLDKPDPARHRTAARKRIIRAVEDLIQRADDDGIESDPDSADALHAELHERLDAPDLDADIATRPVPDIIADITRDLGLGLLPGTRPFQRRTPADVALLCARAAAPTSQAGAGPQGLVQPQPSAARRHPGTQPDRSNPARPGAGLQGPGQPRPAAARNQPGTYPDRRDPDRPAARAGDRPDDPFDPAEVVASILRQGAPAHPRWRPPPGG